MATSGYMKGSRLPTGEPTIPKPCRANIYTMLFSFRTFHSRFVTVFIINLATTTADECGASSDLTRVTARRQFVKIYCHPAAASISVNNRRISVQSLRPKINPPHFSNANFWSPWWAGVPTECRFILQTHTVHDNINPRHLSTVDSNGDQRLVSLIMLGLLRKSWRSND